MGNSMLLVRFQNINYSYLLNIIYHLDYIVNMSSARLVVKIWDADRIIKKSFLFTGDISGIIQKGNYRNIQIKCLIF